MTDDAHGIAGDRRRNPFPSMTETEYQLFLLTVEKRVEAGVTRAMVAYRHDNCGPHLESTDHLKTVVFGSSERGIVGLDQRVAENTVAIRSMSTYITWLKVTLTASLLSLVVGLAALVLGK